MIREVNIEILRIALISASSLLLGFLVGYPVAGLIAGLTIYVLWVSSQIASLARWVASAPNEPPPVSSGIFEFIFERLFRTRRDHDRLVLKLKQELKHNLEMIADVRDGVVLIDDSGRIVWFNNQASHLLGISTPRDIGAQLVNFLRAPEFVAYFNKRDYTEPLKVLSPSNLSQWLEFSVTLFANGESLILIRDISRMQKLEIARRDFVANLSHELRTPLTVLQGYIETLQSAENSPAVSRALPEMERQSKRMLNLLTDLSTLSRLESVDPPSHRDWLRLADPIRQICAEAESLFKDLAPEISLDLDETLALRGDLTELYSAFTNLITNAIKYSGEGSKISVTWKADDSGGRFSVSDNGPGIDPRHVPRLTERFYRADPGRDRESGGTGLGLAIVKHVLLRHKADLIIDSKPGAGSTFSCHFDADRVRREPASESHQESLTASNNG